MKFLIVFALVAAASADVAHLDAAAPIVKASYDIQPQGDFQYSYETGNGIYAQSSGVVKNPNSDQAYLEVSGGYKYTAPDGTPVELSYVANEGGYQPQGSHLPVPPPTPEAIARSLAYIAAHPVQVAERVVTAPVRAAAAILG